MPRRSLTDIELLEQIQQLSKAAREQLLAGDPTAARITRTQLLRLTNELTWRSSAPATEEPITRSTSAPRNLPSATPTT